jgi:hypothetical protein
VAGGHSIDDPEPNYGMAVTGTADPAALLRIDAGQPGLPLTLTKPIGTGAVNAGHKATGKVSAAAIEVMTTLNADASRRARAAGIRCATDVTGFGLLGHLFKLARASGSPRSSTARRCRSSTGRGRRRGPGMCLAGAGETCNGCSRTPTPGTVGEDDLRTSGAPPVAAPQRVLAAGDD